MKLSMSIQDSAYRLNKWDATPLVSSVYSGPARIVLGSIQLVAGTALTGIASVFGALNGAENWGQDLKINVTEVFHGIGNVIRGCVAFVPILGNVMIYLYDQSPLGTVVLERDSEGYYTLPQFSVPGFTNMGTTKGKELNIQVGEYVIDTENGIVPNGWVLLR